MPINSFLYPAKHVPVVYDVANSARFENSSSDYLNRTPSSTSNRKTFTFSFWVKRTKLGTNDTIYNVRPDSNGANRLSFHSTTDTFRIALEPISKFIFTTRKFRDVSAWYHIVAAFDTTQATASNRVKIYINGVQEGSLVKGDGGAATYPDQNTDLDINTQNVINLGRDLETSSDFIDMYLAEFVFIDGTALDPTSFGEFDSDSGIWKPIDVSGLTFGTNGFYLDFEDSSALGDDVSGNGNDFTVNNLTAIDQSTDTCTNNFATWNPLWSQSNGNIGDVIFSEGNLKTTTSANYRTYPTTIGFSSGKWYWEIRRYEDDGSNDMHTGVMSELATPANTATWIGNAANGWVFATDAGSTYTGGTESNTGYSSAPNAGDIVQVAFNADDGKIYFGVNGTWQNSGNPATGTNPAYTGLDTSLFYFPCASTGSDVEGNFGSPSYTISSGNTDGNGYGNFEYAVPSGYYALNTKNLAEYG